MRYINYFVFFKVMQLANSLLKNTVLTTLDLAQCHLGLHGSTVWMDGWMDVFYMAET